MKIGYVGLGAMGAPMVARLAERFPGAVTASDVDAARTATVASQTGAFAAEDRAHAVRGMDVVVTCVPNNASVRQLYLGDGGIAEHIAAGAVSIDVSTVGPDATEDVAAGVAKKGASHLDASMLGSVAQAESGTISFVVGGEADALEKARPVLEACGGMIRHCGPSGAGNRMKLIHQTLVAGHAVAVGEALTLAEETGTDLDIFYDIVTGGTGFAYSRYFEKRVPRMRDGDFDPLFMLRFMLKDARLAREMGHAPYPALDAAIAALEAADAEGLGGEDFSAVFKSIRARS